jgi:hypothetical protein
MVHHSTTFSAASLLSEACSASGLSDAGLLVSRKPVIDIDPEGSPLFPTGAWEQMDRTRVRLVLDRIGEYYEGLLKPGPNHTPDSSERELLLFAARLTDVLSLRFPDLFSSRSAKNSYLSLLALTGPPNDDHILLNQVLLRFLKRGWLSDAATLAHAATAAYMTGTPPDRFSGSLGRSETECRIESLNVLSLYHYLSGEPEVAESMIVSGLDCICNNPVPDLSDTNIGLTFQLLVNYARILAGTNRKAQAVRCFSTLQCCLHRLSLTPRQSSVFGHPLPGWFEERCLSAEEHLVRAPDRMVGKEMLWLLMPPAKEIAAVRNEYSSVLPAGNTDVDLIVQGLTMWGQEEYELAWAAWQAALLCVEEQETFAITCFLVATYYGHKGQEDLARAAAMVVVRCLKARITEGNPLSGRETRLTRLLGRLIPTLGLDVEYSRLVELLRNAAVATENELALTRLHNSVAR